MNRMISFGGRTWWMGAIACAGALLMGVWQAANLLLGVLVGDDIGELQVLVRVSAAAGAIAMLVTLPALPRMLRWARRSAWLATLRIPAGAVGVYWLLPRVFVYADF